MIAPNSPELLQNMVILTAQLKQADYLIKTNEDSVFLASDWLMQLAINETQWGGVANQRIIVMERQETEGCYPEHLKIL